MIGYFVFFIILFILLKGTSSKSKPICVFFLIWFFSSLRYGIGSDWYAYYTTAYLDNGDRLIKDFEPISRFFFQISYETTPFAFFWLSSGFINYFFIRSISYISKYDNLFNERIILYICFPFFFPESLSLIRQLMAISVVFYAITVCYAKPIRQLILIAIAYCCHISGPIGLIALLPWGKLKRKAIFLMFVIAIITGETMFLLLNKFGLLDNPAIQYYIVMGDSFKGGAKIQFLLYAIVCFVLIKYHAILRINEINAYYMNLTIMSVAVFSIIINISPTTAQRMCTFFYVSLIVYVPYLLRSYKIAKPFYYFACITLFGLYIAVQHKATIKDRKEDPPGYSAMYPYRTYLFD